jgi:hypothetical protein
MDLWAFTIQPTIAVRYVQVPVHFRAPFASSTTLLPGLRRPTHAIEPLNPVSSHGESKLRATP